MPPYAMRRCGQCCHWFKIEGGIELQRVPQGQCRRMPPSAQMVNAQQTAAFYPPVPADFGACGEFKSLLSLHVEDDQEPA